MRQGTGKNVSGHALPADLAARQEADGNGSLPPRVLSDQADVGVAIAAERARIAREMDETVSKSLLGVSMVAASLASASPATDLHALDQQLRELTRLARRAVSDARSVIHDLRGEALGGEVRSIATAWGILAGVKVSVDLSPDSGASADARCEILAVLREALRNVEQHACASQVNVSLQRAGELLLLTIADDGIGFRPPTDLEELRAIGRRGLAGMDERARDMGGSLVIKSWPGQGTHLELGIHAPTPARGQLRPCSSPSQVRVIIADSNPVLRLGLRAALEQVTGIMIAGEADNGADTVALVRRLDPDVLVLDIRMPLPEGSATISQLSQLTRVLMLTCVDDAGLVMKAVTAGASGGVLRGELEPGELIQAVLDAARHRPVAAQPASPGRAGSLQSNVGAEPRPLGLRPRELEVMGLIAEGLSNRQIADRLVITEKTVKNHICSIYQRFGVSGRREAVSRWRELWRLSDSPADTSR
jgi:DNA-binding NarL/FixJ family response regulator/two-component sensor histidine kinase